MFVAGRGAASPFGAGHEPFLRAVFAGEVAPSPGAADPLQLACRAGREAAAGFPAGGLVLSTTKADMAGIAPELEGATPGFGIPRRLLERLARELPPAGPRAAVSCACASGLTASALAARWLRAGRCERALVVGVDVLTSFVQRGFGALMALDPGPCRPFDRERRGLNLGQGAGALLLSTDPRDSIGVELIGWGESNDANHITGPSRDGLGLYLAARRALRKAQVSPGEVDYIHLHGTGTRYNDATEALALERLFEGTTPPASGTKAQTGHTLGAAGVLESIVATEALLRGIAPGNVGLRETDVAPALSLVGSEPRPLERARVALKVSAGFGGINAALLFRRHA